ncbi:hypothetical protein M422DRAFT_106479, partial [Sphaerobolus stellatus SS14]
TVTTLTSTTINAFTPYTYYAATAYCTPTVSINWSCGAKCTANSRFVPTASGGDGSSVQYWYVGYDSTLNTVIVAHQGTDTSKILADLTDADLILSSIASTNFPGITNLGIKIHQGFLNAHAIAAPYVLAATTKTLTAHSGASVTLVGHSLGAALALIDALYLPLHLPSGTKFKMVGYGMPRVGNDAFAAYLDANFSDITHINNKEDVVPIVPGRSLGFKHTHGEVHITDDNVWHACAGNDNTSTLCTVDDVTSVLVGTTNDHTGPYNGIKMG